MSLSKIKKLLFLLLFLSPPCFILFAIGSYGVDFPFWDQWDFAPKLERFLSGEMPLSQLWEQHNEHRILFPRIIMLGLACFTGWSVKAEMYVNLFLAALTLNFLILILRNSFASDHSPPSAWLILILSFLVFSPIQWENWTWGWQIQIYLSVFATVAAVWAIDRSQGRLSGILIGAGFALVAGYSFNNGLTAWVVCLPLIVRENGKDGRQKKVLLLWTALMVLTIASYYYHYSKPPLHPDLTLFLSRPLEFIQYLLAYLGAPLGFDNRIAAMSVGATSTLIIYAGSAYLWRADKERMKRMLPWPALASYSFLSAAATAVGRLGMGVDQALASRYTTISGLYTVSAIVMLFAWVRCVMRKRRHHALIPLFLASFFVLSAISYGLSFKHGWKMLSLKQEAMASALECVKSGIDTAPDECLRAFFHSPAKFRQSVRRLSGLGIVFPDFEPVWWNSMKRIKGGAFGIDMLKVKDGYLTAAGWAVDNINMDLAHAVYVVVDGTPVAKANYGIVRQGLPYPFDGEKYKAAGWEVSVNYLSVNPGRRHVSLRIAPRDNRKEYLEPAKKAIIEVPYR